MSDLERRRLAFGDNLRLLRESTGLSGKRLAEQLHWPASKISKIETGRQQATDSDVVAITGQLGVDADATEQLRDELRAIRLEENRWTRQLRVGHRPVQEAVARAERDAAVIRSLHMTVVPGLLQTAEYARHVFLALAEVSATPRDTDDAVRARMERQQVLYDQDKRIELLVAEAALRHPIGPPVVMMAQVDRIMAVRNLPSLRLGILPMSTVLPVLPMNDFVIRDDTVSVDLSHTEMVSREPQDVTLYQRLFDRLWAVAVEGDVARALLARIAAELAG